MSRGIESLTPDLWKGVLPHTSPSTVASLAQVSKKNHALFQNHYEEFYIHSNGILSKIVERSSLIPKSNNYHDRIATLDSYLQFARDIDNAISELFKKHRNRFGFADLFNTLKASMINLSGNIQLANPNNGATLLQILKKTYKITPDILFLSACLLHDESLYRSFHLSKVDRKIVDFAAYFFLKNQKIENFHELLPFSSIGADDFPAPYISGKFPIWAMEAMNILLYEAVELYRLDIFQSLLQISKPYGINTALIRFAENNQAAAISLILRFSDHTISTSQYIESKNGQNLRLLTHPPIIAKALIEASINPFLEGFEAILAGRPGNGVTREALEDLKERFQISTDLRFANHPRRGHIIQRLTAEITSRYG